MGKLRKSGEKHQKQRKTKELNEKEPKKINRFPLFMMKNGL